MTTTNDQTIEAEIQTKGLAAPRVKPEDLTANIAHTEYVTHVSAGGQVLRWAILTTRNGFAVTGRPSVSVSPANDNEQIGRVVAYENARNELWPLMGYALRERLAAAPLVLKPLTPEQHAELCEAMLKSPPMPLVLVDEPQAIKWTVLVAGDDTTLPAPGFWLVTVDTDSGREVHVLEYAGKGKWLHEGEYTFQHGYYFRPIAWAPRPAAFDGEVPE